MSSALRRMMWLLVVLGGTAPSASYGIVIDAARNPEDALVPFSVNPLSGVGRLGLPGGTCSASAISPTAVLTAGHCLESSSTSLFKDPTGFHFIIRTDQGFIDDPANGLYPNPGYRPGPRTRPVSGFANDIAVVTLQNPLPNYVPIYPLASVGNPAGAAVTLVGVGRTGNGFTGDTTFDAQLRFGLNEVAGFSYDHSIIQIDFDASAYANGICDKACQLSHGAAPGHPPYGFFESITAPGDSGGAMLYNPFIDATYNLPPDVEVKPLPDMYSLLAVTSHGTGSHYGDTAGYTLVAPFLSWITSIVTGATLTSFDEPVTPKSDDVIIAAEYSIEPPNDPAPIPEPGTLSLLGLGLLGAGALRRRKAHAKNT